MPSLAPAILVLATALMLVFGPAPGLTPDAMADDAGRARELRDAKSILPLSGILQGVEKSHGGVVLDIDLEEEDERILYEVEIMDADHRIHHIEIDARTGKLLRDEVD